MNLEAINKWLDEEYGCSYTRLEELHDFYFENYCDLKKENKQLKAQIEEYQQENKILRENAENNDKVVDKVNWDNMLLKKENKQLKIQISAREEVCNRLESNWNKLNKKYENAVADYEKTMFEKEQLNSLVNSCQEEIRQLKKQLEDYKKLGFKHLQDKNNNLETQQKEFIKYLEDESKEIYRDGGLRQYIFRQILRKYRSITGVSDENNIK